MYVALVNAQLVDFAIFDHWRPLRLFGYPNTSKPTRRRW